MNPKRTAKAKEIALSALQLFVTKGYAATSVEEIAAKVNIGKSTIYEYYATKEELFVEAIMMGAGLFIADLESIGSDCTDPIERLRKISNLFIKAEKSELAMESRLFVEFLSHAILNGGAFYDLRHVIQDMYQQVVRIVTDFLLAGVSKGQLRPDIASNAKKIAINYLAYLDGIKMHCMIAENYIQAGDQIEFYLKQLTPLIQLPQDDYENRTL